jgi:hypothetical protein
MEENQNSGSVKPQNQLGQQAEISASGLEANNTPEAQKQDTNQQEPLLTTQMNEMEVHHHSHIRHRKEWMGYLFEFLMLFLAVTAGFLVENRREHYIEHKRAKQFSKQLLADLRADSSLLAKQNERIKSMYSGYDTLLYMLTQRRNASDKQVLETLLPLSFAFDVPAVTTTYNQMKTSGSLRYIENTHLISQLQSYYDVLLPRSVRIAEASLVYFTDHINSFYLQHIRIQDIDPFNDSLIDKSPQIIGRNQQTDQQLANIMGNYRSLLVIQQVTMNEPALNKIRETIPLLQKEYHLK